MMKKMKAKMKNNQIVMAVTATTVRMMMMMVVTMMIMMTMMIMIQFSPNGKSKQSKSHKRVANNRYPDTSVGVASGEYEV